MNKIANVKQCISEEYIHLKATLLVVRESIENGARTLILVFNISGGYPVLLSDWVAVGHRRGKMAEYSK